MSGSRETPSILRSVQPSTPDKTLLRFITCGSVDDGKSSLIGRVLFESGSVPDDQLATLAKDSKKFGTQGDNLDYALLVDGLSAEREQGITIDVAYRYFSTRNRAFIVADTPGHEQYTRNMATGASNAELAIILVDARKGILPQTRRHSFIVSMMGVKHVVVAINKMDLVEYSPFIFNAIEKSYREIAASLNISHVTVIPVSAVNGDNIATRSGNTPWYHGPTLIDHLETAEISTSPNSARFALPVQWVNRPDANFRGFSGLIASGHVKPGDRITVLPSKRDAVISRIVTFDGDLDQAEAGQSVTIALDREVDISRGDVLALSDNLVGTAKSVEAQILWMSAEPLQVEKSYLAKIGAVTLPVIISRPETALDIENYAERPVTVIDLNTIFLSRVTFDRIIPIERYDDIRDLGSFILIDRMTHEVAALGIVRALETPAILNSSKSGTKSVRPVYEPLRRSHLKTASFAASSLIVGLLITLLSLAFAFGTSYAIGIFALVEILLFFGHERLWARTNRGLQVEASVLSAGEGI